MALSLRPLPTLTDITDEPRMCPASQKVASTSRAILTGCSYSTGENCGRAASVSATVYSGTTG